MATLLRDALQNEVSRIEARIKLAVKADTDTGSDPYLLVEKQNKIKLLELEINDTQPIQLKGESKTEYDADLKIYKSRVQAMEKYHGQAFSMIKGQCTLALESKMKCDSDYTACMASNDPLWLKAPIERTIISQSANKYTFAVLYE